MKKPLIDTMIVLSILAGAIIGFVLGVVFGN